MPPRRPPGSATNTLTMSRSTPTAHSSRWTRIPVQRSVDHPRRLHYVPVSRGIRVGRRKRFRAAVLRDCCVKLNEKRLKGGLKKPETLQKKIAEWMKIYQAVTWLMTRSGGAKWDDDLGVNPTTEEELALWEEDVRAKPPVKPFKYQGWAIYKYIQKLDPAKPKGDNVFRPRGGPDWDESQLNRDFPNPPSNTDDAPGPSGGADGHQGTPPPATPAPGTQTRCSHSFSTSLAGFTKSYERQSTLLIDSMNRVNSQASPVRRGKAMELVMKEDWLTEDQQLQLGDVVQNAQQADTYVQWAQCGSPMRRRWISRALNI
ncbi:hypothetical protein HMN09_01418900 [Mycena chlorophos]|uniref:Myb/SANT-like domain-containing protein n=1 Tax=Mycena chlorophos TaxID=658473 RepID=A0A8H6RX43_MYCCL|nr:hypothetical protein HMN09_01418900 [Mycena chlorophos]